MSYEADYTPEERKELYRRYKQKIRRNVKAFADRSLYGRDRSKEAAKVYLVKKKKNR